MHRAVRICNGDRSFLDVMGPKALDKIALNSPMYSLVLDWSMLTVISVKVTPIPLKLILAH